MTNRTLDKNTETAEVAADMQRNTQRAQSGDVQPHYYFSHNSGSHLLVVKYMNTGTAW